MRKYLLSALAVAVLFLASCGKDSYYHTMSLIYPSLEQPSIVYADQKLDSVLFYTTDTYKITSTESWLTPDHTMSSMNVQNSYHSVYSVWQFRVYVNTEPNTEGKVRSGYLHVNSQGDDDWDNTATAMYYQLAWMNIWRPAPILNYNDGQAVSAIFKIKDAAEVITDTLEFEAHGDWTLKGGSIIRPETVSEGRSGKQKIALAIEPNTTYTERQGKLILSCNGVSEEIVFIQEAKQNEN